MKNFKVTTKLAVLMALAIPVGAEAALTYTPPQAIVVTCNGQAPQVLKKNTDLAQFSCTNGAKPQAVGITHGLGDLLGLASGAALFAGSEALPGVSLPGASGPVNSPVRTNNGSGNGSNNGSNSGNNGSGSHSGNGSNGSNSGNNGSNSGNSSGNNGSGSGSGNGSSSGSGSNGSNTGNSSGNSGSGSNSGSSASPASSSGSGGWLGNIVGNIGHALGQIGHAVATGGSVSIPLTGNSGNTGGLSAGGSSSEPFGGQNWQYNYEVTNHYPVGQDNLDMYFGPTGEPSSDSDLWWLLKQEIHHELRTGSGLPFRYTNVSLSTPKVVSGDLLNVGQGMAFCENVNGGAADTFAPIQFQALTCRVRQNGQLSVASNNRGVEFTVPQGQYGYAYTNDNGNNPKYYLQLSTQAAKNTSGYVFPTQYLQANASFAEMAKWVDTYSSCVAGPIVHERDGVPMIWQMNTYVAQPYSAPTVHISAVQNNTQPAPKYRPSTPAEIAAANPACFGYMGYSKSSLRSQGVVKEYLAEGSASLEIRKNGVWLTAPTPIKLSLYGPTTMSQSALDQYAEQALSADTVVNGKTLVDWGVPEYGK